jgi:hypothetical protein
VFIVPVKLPSPCAVGDEHVERCGQDAKPTDVHPIEIEEAEECSNFLQCHGSLPVSYALDFHGVHGNQVLADDYAEVFHLVDLKDTFLGFEVEIIFCEDAQDIVDYSPMEGVVVWGVDKDVIHANCYISLIDKIMEYVVHHQLESHWGVREAEEHNHWFKQSLVGLKCGLPLVTIVDANIVVPPVDIKLCKECQSMTVHSHEPIHEFVYQGEWVL